MKKINKITPPPPENLDNFQTVSFDIFDTLVHRLTAAPMDIFDAVRSQLIHSELALSHPKLIANFPHFRRSSEQKAREVRLQQFGGDAEIRFDEIYDQLILQYPMDNATRQLLQETELSLEKRFLYRSQDGFAQYNQAITKGKRVLFISDMYLPQAFVIEMLRDLGFQAASTETVFVSGEHRCNKHSGKLYQFVQEQCGLNPQTWLHFGDNVHADVESARKMGLTAEHATWSKVNNIPRHCAKIADALPESIIGGINLPQHKAIYQAENGYQDLGYRIFAPFVFGYYIWFMKQINALKPDKILFFARDAYLIKQIHEIIHPQYEVDSEYVYVSRKSLYPLSLTDCPLWRIDYLIGGYVSRTLKNICNNYQLDLSQFTLNMAQLGLSPDTIITRENHHLAYQFFSQCFHELAYQSVQNRAQLKDYFLNLVQDCQHVAVVDIGWSGNIQAAFSRILQTQRQNTRLSGLYLGLNSGAARNLSSQNNMSGYFMNLKQNQENEKLIAEGGALLSEFMLTSYEGSTLGYQKDEQGNITPILEQKNTQEQEYERAAMEVQKGILAFVRNYAFLLQTFPLEALDSLKWSQPFCELVQNPSREQIALLADLTHSDVAGDNQQRLPFAPKLSLFHRLFRTKKYRRAYETAFWRKGFYYRNQRDPRRYRG